MNGRILKVLLVEDNPGDMRLVREMLAEAEGTKFEIEWAERLSVGLERLSAGELDLVLLDLSLPDSHGLETFARVHEAAPYIPIVVISGFDDESAAVTAVQAGAQDYLVKGDAGSNLLVRSVRYAVERKSLENERETLISKLQDALARINTLQGLLPICARCKRIRDDKGYWNQMEVYISEHSGAEFSHGICPECMERLYPDCVKRSA